MKPLQKVTIYDLAKELNTSASTVSRALQNHPRISEKMKKAVSELAEKMNYHPDPVAHHLRTGKDRLSELLFRGSTVIFSLRSSEESRVLLMLLVIVF